MKFHLRLKVVVLYEVTKKHFKAQCPKNRRNNSYRYFQGKYWGKRGEKIQGNVASTSGQVVLIAFNCADNHLSSSNHLIKEDLEPYMNNITKLSHDVCFARHSHHLPTILPYFWGQL